jgi:hypothetical protein
MIEFTPVGGPVSLTKCPMHRLGCQGQRTTYRVAFGPGWSDRMVLMCAAHAAEVSR